VGSLQILNPGSVYGVTARDSHTCATLTLPARDYTPPRSAIRYSGPKN
jgi:hypothetical protein